MNWKKSSYSTAGGDCVEVGADGSPVVAIRNSKAPERSTLTFDAGAVAAFVDACRTGELDDLGA